MIQAIGEVSTRTAEKSTPIVARLIVRGFSKAVANADLATSIDFMRGRLTHARDEWEEIVRKIAEIPGVQRVEGDGKDMRHATINQAHDRDAA